LYHNIYHRARKECRETTVIKGVTIPEGAAVVIPIYLLQLDPQYWKNPKQFDPEK
jgi:cytochrome P450